MTGVVRNDSVNSAAATRAASASAASIVNRMVLPTVTPTIPS